MSGKNFKIDYSHRNLAALDLTHMLMDEALPVAKAVGVGEIYKKMAETGEMNFEQIEKYLKLLDGKQESWVAKQIGKAEPFAGSIETIIYLKKMEFETVFVTDDALMSLRESNDMVREKLGADKIIPTAEIECYDGKICGGLKNTRTKPQILGGLIEEYKPSHWLCMVQGINDIEMAKCAREKGAIVISVNSHSPELESVSHYHIDSISKAPKLLEELFSYP